MKEKILKIENLFLIVCLFWGLLFMLINPPFQAPDEPEHMFKMYGYTEGSLNFKMQNGWSGQILPSSFVKLFDRYGELRFTRHKTSLYETDKYSKIKLDKEKTEFLRYNVSSYTPLSYFPSFVVLWILKLLNTAPIAMMYILRFCSLLTYLALGYAAIKITPCKKWAFFLLQTLPLNLSQAASVSTDSIMFGLVFLFLAYTFKLKFSADTVTLKQTVKWGVLSLVLCILKFAYAPLILLYFLIPKQKFENSKDYLKNFFIILAADILVIAVFLGNTLSFSDLREYAYTHKNAPAFSVVKAIIAHPLNYAQMVVKTTIASAPMYYQNVISNIGIMLLVIPIFGTNLYWLLLFLSVLYTPQKEAQCLFSAKDKLVFTASILVSYLLVLTSVFLVYQTYPLILGMQGRYLMPLLPLFVMLFAFNKVRLKNALIPWIIFTVSQFLLLVTLFIFIVRFY